MAKGGSETTVQKNEPPAYVQPYLTGGGGHVGVLPEAEKLYRSDQPSYFPGSTVAPFAPESELAFTMGANRAIAGSPLTASASDLAMRTLGGEYLGQENPYLEGIRGRVGREASRLAGDLSGGGESAMQESIARGVAEGLAPWEFQTYGQERGFMNNAMQFAPQLAGEDWRDIAALQGIGGARQAQGQAELGDEVRRRDFEQNIDQEKLNRLLAAVYGAPGSTQYTQVPGQDPWQSIFGGLLGAAGTAAMFV